MTQARKFGDVKSLLSSHSAGAKSLCLLCEVDSLATLAARTEPAVVVVLGEDAVERVVLAVAGALLAFALAIESVDIRVTGRVSRRLTVREVTCLAAGHAACDKEGEAVDADRSLSVSAGSRSRAGRRWPLTRPNGDFARNPRSPPALDRLVPLRSSLSLSPACHDLL